MRIPTTPVPAPRTVAGLDVSYDTDSDRVAAAGVVVDTGSLEVVEEAVVTGTVTFPYRRGLLAFREAPILIRLLHQLHTRVDLLLATARASPIRGAAGSRAIWACSPGCPRSAAPRTT